MVKKKIEKAHKPITAFFHEVQRSMIDNDDNVVIINDDNTPSSSTTTSTTATTTALNTTSLTSSSSRKRKRVADSNDEIMTMKAPDVSSPPSLKPPQKPIVLDMALSSPTQSEVHPSAHPDMDNMLSLIQHSRHYVYGLFLLNADGITIDHCFYVGETSLPESRFMQHRSKQDNNEVKNWYFDNYPRNRIRMIILYSGDVGRCLVLEKMFIQNGEALNFKLTNNKKGAQIILKCNMIKGLQQIIHVALSKNEGYSASAVQKSPETLEHENSKKIVKRGRIYTQRISESFRLLRSGKAIRPTYSNPPLQSSETSSSSKTSDVTKLFRTVRSAPPQHARRTPSPLKNIDPSDLVIPISHVPADIVLQNIASLKAPYNFAGGKTSLVHTDTIIDPKTLVGTFRSMTEAELSEIVHDEGTSIAFGVRCGLVGNKRKCPKCKKAMKAKYCAPANRWFWRCRYSVEGKSVDCVQEQLLFGSKLHVRNLKGPEVIKALYHTAHGQDNRELRDTFQSLTQWHTKLTAYATAIRDEEIDPKLMLYSTNKNASAEYLRKIFFSNEKIDKFGYLLSWLKF